MQFVVFWYLWTILRVAGKAHEQRHSIYYKSISLVSSKLTHVPEWFRSTTSSSRFNVSSAVFSEASAHNMTQTWLDLDSGISETTGRYYEDRVAVEHFFSGYSNGLVVDIGGGDGRLFSSSYVLERVFNWQAIIMEGNPLLAESIPSYRPNALALNVVTCNAKKSVPFSYYGLSGGILDFMPKTSMLARYFNLDYLALRGGNRDIQKVECIPLHRVFSVLDVHHVDLLFIDINGAELSALNTLDFDNITISVIAVGIPEDENDNYKTSVISYMTDTLRYTHVSNFKNSVLFDAQRPYHEHFLWFTAPYFSRFKYTPTK